MIAGDNAMVCYHGAIGGLPVAAPRSFLFPTGFGTLGFAVPAALGAALGAPERPVAALSGDGGLMFSVGELASAAALGLALPVVVFVNGGYGEIRNEMGGRGPAAGRRRPARAGPARARARARVPRHRGRGPGRPHRGGRRGARRAGPDADRGAGGMTAPPYLSVTWHDPVTGRPGYLVIDRLIDGGSGGGLRMRDGCTLAEVGDLARAMSLKEAVVYDPADAYYPFGGAKGGIDCDPYDPAAEGVLRRYAEAMRPFLERHWATGEDFGLQQPTIDAAFAEAGLRSSIEAALLRLDDPAAGLARLQAAFAVDVDGISLGEVVGGFGVAEAALAALERSAWRRAPPAPSSKGSARWAARPRATWRGRASAWSGSPIARDWSPNPDGLDVERLLRSRDAHGAIDRAALAGEQQRPGTDWLALDAELLVPAALSYVIGREETDRIGARVIVEAANVPTSPEAERLLAARGVLVVPDFVANVATNAWWWWTLFGDIAPERDAAFAKIAATQRRLVGALLDRAAADGVLPARRGHGDRRREPRAARGRPRRGRVAVLRRLVAALAVLGASAPAAAAAPHELTVGVSGDLLPHLPVVARAVAYGGGRPDFRPMLRRIRPWVRRNDLSLCHVETPLVPGAPAGYPRFSSPPELARAIRWAGFDACSTASNHSVDRGAHGIATTRAALGRQGVRHTGSSSTERQRRSCCCCAPAACGSRSSPTRSTRTASRSRTSGRSTSPPPAGSSATPVAPAARARRR